VIQLHYPRADLSREIKISYADLLKIIEEGKERIDVPAGTDEEREQAKFKFRDVTASGIAEMEQVGRRRLQALAAEGRATLEEDVSKKQG
jgi:hypothetical protein